MMSSIVTPTHQTVKCNFTESPVRHQRIKRNDLAVYEIDPTLKAFARHIRKCQRKKQPVRIPSMKAKALGQLLRSLELRKAWA
ncbi:hypothetical protein [Xenorhabdus sp. SGI246]|uniref:hypothetical protein n=1 Tax=Xenorhabdus sp. SGI246 TaxID=3158263 RepID=UPI00349F7311